jgi:hypothetical protein
MVSELTLSHRLVAGQKLIRKPIVDGDWDNEYTGDVRGFMRIEAHRKGEFHGCKSR